MSPFLSVSFELACVVVTAAIVIAAMIVAACSLYSQRTRPEGDQFLTPTPERRYREAQGHE